MTPPDEPDEDGWDEAALIEYLAVAWEAEDDALSLAHQVEAEGAASTAELLAEHDVLAALDAAIAAAPTAPQSIDTDTTPAERTAAMPTYYDDQGRVAARTPDPQPPTPQLPDDDLRHGAGAEALRIGNARRQYDQEIRANGSGGTPVGDDPGGRAAAASAALTRMAGGDHFQRGLGGRDGLSDRLQADLDAKAAAARPAVQGSQWDARGHLIARVVNEPVDRSASDFHPDQSLRRRELEAAEAEERRAAMPREERVRQALRGAGL